MRFILPALTALTLTACASSMMAGNVEVAPVSKEFPVTKPDAYKRVVQALAGNGFTIYQSDAAAGIVTTNPKGFPYQRGVMRVQTTLWMQAQVIIGEKSAKVTYTYACEGLQHGVLGVMQQMASPCYQREELTPVIEKSQADVDSLIKSAI